MTIFDNIHKLGSTIIQNSPIPPHSDVIPQLWKYEVIERECIPAGNPEIICTFTEPMLSSFPYICEMTGYVSEFYIKKIEWNIKRPHIEITALCRANLRIKTKVVDYAIPKYIPERVRLPENTETNILYLTKEVTLTNMNAPMCFGKEKQILQIDKEGDMRVWVI